MVQYNEKAPRSQKRTPLQNRKYKAITLAALAFGMLPLCSLKNVVSNVAQVRKYQEVHWKFISDHAKEFVLNISIVHNSSTWDNWDNQPVDAHFAYCTTLSLRPWNKPRSQKADSSAATPIPRFSTAGGCLMLGWDFVLIARHCCCGLSGDTVCYINHEKKTITIIKTHKPL